MKKESKIKEIPLNIREQINKYLSSTFCIFEMVKSVGHRAVSFKLFYENKEDDVMVRYFVSYSVKLLLSHIERMELKTIPRNIYVSCSSMSFIPILTYDFKNRKKSEKYQEFDKNYEQYIQTFDEFFDFDGKEDFNKAYQEATEFKKRLDEYKLPYYVINSSGKGWHFVIEGRFLPSKPFKELLKNIQTIYFNIKGIHEFQYLDKSVLNDLKQLRKCPYSPTIDGYICLPLDDSEFLKCGESMDFLKIENVMKNIRIKERGLKIRDYGLDEKTLKANVEKFWKKYL